VALQAVAEQHQGALNAAAADKANALREMSRKHNAELDAMRARHEAAMEYEHDRHAKDKAAALDAAAHAARLAWKRGYEDMIDHYGMNS